MKILKSLIIRTKMVIKIVMIIILYEFIKNNNNSICIGNKTRNV